MTAKQKVLLVAAQYVAKARAMTLEGDRLARVAELLEDEDAEDVFSALVKLGLVNEAGVLLENSKLETIVLDMTGEAN